MDVTLTPIVYEVTVVDTASIKTEIEDSCDEDPETDYVSLSSVSNTQMEEEQEDKAALFKEEVVIKEEFNDDSEEVKENCEDDNTKHTCQFCGYRTSIKCNLHRHLITHTGEKPLKCDLCTFQTNRSISLKHHMSVHTGEYRIMCEMCDFKTNRHGYYKKHLARCHNDEKRLIQRKDRGGKKSAQPLRCEHCKYTTLFKDCLTMHIKRHVGEKRFACNVCSFKSVQKSDLKTHMIIHSGEKPFSCELCEYRAKRKFHIKIHMKVHNKKGFKE